MKTPNKERCEQILKLRDENMLSYAQIGKLIKPPVTKQTVYEIYVREKARSEETKIITETIVKKDIPLKNKITELYKRGLRQSSIAKLLIISRQRVGQIILNYNFVPEKIKNEVLMRDNNCCVLCGEKEKLNIHHIDIDSLNNNTKNLITLCVKCHKKQHIK